MHRGLTMTDEEKARRHAALYETVRTHTSHTWAATLAKILLQQIGRQNLAKMTLPMPKDRLEAQYRAASKRLFLLDYDVRSALVWPPMQLVREGTNDICVGC